MKKSDLVPYKDFSKQEKKTIQKTGRKYLKSLSYGFSPIDYLMFQQQKRQNTINDPPDDVRIDFHEGGVFFGRDPSGGSTYYIGKHQQDDGHILIVGSPGCHKTTGIILPSILTWRGTFVAIDVKGDISDFCIRHSSKIAYPIRILDFSGDSAWHYDPFLQLRMGGKDELISNARDLALAIIPTPNDIREPFWVQGAQNILTSIILYAFEHGMNFNEMIEMALTTPMEEIQQAISGSDNDAAKSFIMQYSTKPSTRSDISTLLGSFIDMTNHLRDLYTARVQNVFSITGNIVDWKTDSLSYNLVVRIPEAKLNQWSGAVRLILRQLFSTLSNRPEKYTIKGHWQPPFLLLWDELPRFGKFEDLIHAFSTLRSRGVTICATVQSFAQLENIYGVSVRRALVDCCTYIVIGAVQDVETQQYCSALIGSAPIWQPSVGENYYPNRKEFAFSRNLNLSREPILHPEDFSLLDCFVVSSPFGKFFVEKNPLFEKPRLSIPSQIYGDISKQMIPKKIKKQERVLL